ncbi:hypothetical protein GCG54_00006893 [Colletotrichum gloeosporioides]|uniref:Xylanolytic transcriptional activator regulatory domain-containing protein n=1 Tax=Colletotrichum gloeosporioides TaxID=474922 RepID=A0A8H4CQS3_COLGL|nr:uncharacterized protein GCG54_00006893 [Colletotrichum gloeosporioides]KAF3808274.1 hypothetical protein GCG54_00006893 [Colletotrichum gloeosporioides]
MEKTSLNLSAGSAARFAELMISFVRCSKELPKCSACKPWPSACTYSRDKERTLSTKDQTALQPKTSGPAETSSTIGALEQRLQNIERSILNLTKSVEQVLSAVSPQDSTNTVSSSISESATMTGKVDQVTASLNEAQVPNLFLGPSHSFSFLKETPTHIDAVSKSPSTLAHHNAYSELRYLSNTLTTATVSPDTTAMKGFHVPPKSVGYQLIGQFLEHSPLGEPFFCSPSDDLLRQIIFDPANVKQKAWVVYVNYMMLAMVSANESGESVEAKQFRRNMRLALNDSTIFLEPTLANVQALALLALHGEDYASPNLSWMLVGHACRQAEALGLHALTDQDFESRQRSLCLFWLLFVVDKSCSLAFGRSSFLPMSLYRDVPLPDFNFMLKFQPHNSSSFRKSRESTLISTFGAHLLTSGMEVAKMMEYVLDFLTPGKSLLPKETVSRDLDEWYRKTIKVLTEIIDAERPWVEETQLREMSLGISSMKFQYLHIVILLHKGDPTCASIRLESAREALSLLPSMVSNWASVYNGVVWHLLYYPFIPFFVVFENIVHGNSFQGTSTVDQDLSLLSTAVSYFAMMRGQLRLLATVCARLEHVAAVFLQLAQVHVGQRTNAQFSSTNMSGHADAPSEIPPTNFLSYGGHEDVAATLRKAQDDIGTAANLDLEKFLDWLPAEVLPPWPTADTGNRHHSACHVAPDSTVVEGEQAPRGRKRTFDATFDWFSWDAYFADADSRQFLH